MDFSLVPLFLFISCTVLSQTFSDTPENGLPFYSDLYRCNHLSNIIANFGNTSNIMLSKRVVGAVGSGGNDKMLVTSSLLYFTPLNSTPTLSLALDHCSSNVTKQMEQVLIVTIITFSTIITSSTIIIFSTSLLHNLLSTCTMCTYHSRTILYT